ncbi:MAG: tRNA lysidine(34) synthetase TilS [Dermabacter sp.]|nr:tRNA lysidine(34) synthetase TilS [Dermabacter sp.]
MAGPPPLVARARLAVKAALAGRLAELADVTAPVQSEGSANHRPVVLVGVSGGADSLALAATSAWVAREFGLECEAAIIDHRLSEDSARVAERAAATCERLGLTRVHVRRVHVEQAGGGLEDAARTARHQALEELADERSALAILLGHTLDDQAEQVLLGLARGAGARALAGIRRRRGALLRPFLGTGRDETTGLWRADTRAICEALDIDVWDDPMNADETFLRVRVRTLALPALAEILGDHIAQNLVRTADLLADDADYLDAQAREDYEGLARTGRAESSDLVALDVYGLALLPRALRTRVIKHAIHEAQRLGGARASKSLLRRHVLQVDALVSAYRGQGPILLPGKIEAVRSDGLLVFAPGVPERSSHTAPA